MCPLILALSLLATLPSSGARAQDTQQQQGASQGTRRPGGSAPKSTPAAGPVTLTAGEAPGEPPFDVRPALDAYRAGEGQRTLIPTEAQRRHSLVQGDAPLTTPGAAPGDAASLPSASGFGDAPAGSTDKAPTQVCVPMLADSGFDAPGLYWTELEAEVWVASNPTALYMVDGDDFSRTPDTVDAFGQDFIFPADAGSAVIQIEMGYGALTQDEADAVFYNLYLVNANGSLGALLHSGVLPQFNDNLYHPVPPIVVTDPTVIASMQGQRVALVISTATDAFLEFEQVYFNSVQLSACTTPGAITGRWLGAPGDNDLSDALTVLTYIYPDGASEVVAVTFPDAAGNWSFQGIYPPVGNGDAYQVWYLNDGLAPQRLSFWALELVTAFDDIGGIDLGSLNLANTTPLLPAHGAAVTLPAVFQWEGFDDDFYYFCLYDVQDVEKYTCSAPIESQGGTTQGTATLDFLLADPTLDFRYGRTYAWYLYISVDQPNLVEDYGASYEANLVTFLSEPPPPTPGSPPPDNLPTPSNPTAQDWTVMVYMAGDNNLGDPLSPFDEASKLTSHFNALQQLAPQHARVNLVVLADFFDGTGTRFCHMQQSGVANCVQRGEQDTADPQTLASFVADALAQFPASRTMLIIEDHGHAIYGVGQDDTNHPPVAGANSVVSITPDEVRQALGTAGLGPSKKLDVLFYYTCLMGSLEAAVDASAFARFMVSGTDTLWMVNIYDGILALLSDPATSANPRAVAAGIVAAYDRKVAASLPGVYASIAAYDLAQAPAAGAALNALGTALSGSLASARAAITAVRSQQVQVYDSSISFTHSRTEDAFVDLRHLALLMQGNTALPSNVRAAAGNLLTAIGAPGSGLVVASVQRSGDNGEGQGVTLSFSPQAGGIFAFFPSGSPDGDQNTMRAMYVRDGIYPQFNLSSGWGDFVQKYAAPTEVSVARGPGRTARGGRPGAHGYTPSLTRRVVQLPIVIR